MKQPPTVMDNTSDTAQAVAYAVLQRDSSGLDNVTEFPSTDEEHELDFPHNPTITINNNSASLPANEDLDMKLPASMKMDDLMLDVDNDK